MQKIYELLKSWYEKERKSNTKQKIEMAKQGVT